MRIKDLAERLSNAMIRLHGYSCRSFGSTRDEHGQECKLSIPLAWVCGTKELLVFMRHDPALVVDARNADLDHSICGETAFEIGREKVLG